MDSVNESSGDPERGVSTSSPRSFRDSRGATVLLAERERIDFIEYLEFDTAGDVRGGHYHREYEERLYLAEGELLADFLDMADGRSPGRIASIKLKPGETVLIPPAIAHRFTAREPSRAIAFGKGPSPFVDRTDVEEGVWGADTRRFRKAARGHF